jgi:DivIVA domain-containing protein
MPFAPHEIENKKFIVALRGYQTDEVESFLRAVAADYRAALEAASGDATMSEALEAQRIMEAARAAAHAEAAEIRAAAQTDALQIRASARTAANVEELRRSAQTYAREVREAADIEAAEIRDAAIREAEAAYAHIAEQADELRRLEASLWSRMHALEHTVVECRHVLSHVSNLQPMQPSARGADLSTSTLPSVDELLYRVEAAAAASLGTETNAEVATADL